MAFSWQRLKERKIVQWLLAYAAAAVLLVGVASDLAQGFATAVVILRVLVAVLAVGFVAVLVIAWYHGERGQQRVTAAEAGLLAGVVVIAGAAGWIAARTAPRDSAVSATTERTATGPTQQRVAVLSFANLSPDTADAYLAQGISEEITARLGDFADLSVAARSSVELLEGGPGSDVLRNARERDLTHMVEGTVRRSGDRVRVTVRLIDVAEGVRRWQRSYDRGVADLFALQDTIAVDVAHAVAGHLGHVATGRSRSAPAPAAHDQLLRGNYYLAQRNPRALTQAVRSYAEATRLDPSFALGFAKLAFAHLLFLDWGWTYDELTPQGLFARGWQAAERAVQLDSTLADAWVARGSLLAFGNPRTLVGLRQALARAVQLDPRNAEAHHEFAMGLRMLDDDAAAAVQLKQALAIEPDRPMSLVHLAWIDMIARRFDDARRWLDSAVAVNPGFYQAYAERASIRLIQGDTTGARVDAQTAVRLRPATEPLAAEDVLTALALRAGDTAAARARVDLLRMHGPARNELGVHQAAAWAAIMVAAGDTQGAIAFLETTRVAPAHLRFHLKEPRFDALRSNPRFRQLMQKLRVTETRG